MIRPTITPKTGTATATSQARPTSWRRAMITPPTAMIGAITIMVKVISTSICTCCTSLVLRVMSDGAPNPVTSRLENEAAAEDRRPQVTAEGHGGACTEVDGGNRASTWTSETASIQIPTWMM